MEPNEGAVNVQYTHVHTTAWTDQHDYSHRRLNFETVGKIVKHADKDCMLEQGLIKFLSTRDYNDTLCTAHLMRFVKIYSNKDHEASKSEVHFRRQANKRVLHDQVKGPALIKKAMQDKPARPLTALKRDKQAALESEQVEGSTACLPTEVDGIARRAWDNIFQGNHSNAVNLTQKFCRKYHKYIFIAPQAHVQPLMGKSLMHVCVNAKHSVCGLDHFTPQDFSLL